MSSKSTAVLITISAAPLHMQDSHETVLLDEAVAALEIEPTDTIVDATFGAGGHSAKIVGQLGAGGHCIGIDVDESALAHPLVNQENTTLVQGNFQDIDELLSSLHIKNVDGILADLGWRMEQFISGKKGFSFQVDEPLIMTLGNPELYSFTAHDIVNDWDESVLADIIYGYGEERFARRIAKAIVDTRKTEPINSSVQLSEIVYRSVPAPARRGRIHPATKTFQALRIAVNDELGVLETFIKKSLELLKPDARLSIITFHSVEDRLVKRAFRAASDADEVAIITKKPVPPSQEEIINNPRARSAKLRVVEKK